MSTDPSSPRQTISDALKHFGETFPSLTVQEVKASWPKDMGEWLESIQKRNAQHKKRVKQMRKQFRITMELMRVEGVSVRKLTPPVLSDRFKDHVYLDIHGGAFVYYGGLSSIDEGILIAARLGIVVYSIDYRMPPVFPAPFGLRDIEAVYRAFLSQENSKNIFIGGTSAGGGLTIALIQSLIRQNLQLPQAAYIGSPWADLTNTGDSRQTNEGFDRILVTYHGELRAAAALYAGTIPLPDPQISPIYGSFGGFPPCFIVSGTRDLLLSDAIRVNRSIRDNQGTTHLEIVEGLSHAEYLIAYNTPESLVVYDGVSAFFQRHS